jgi:hypothetical protein
VTSSSVESIETTSAAIVAFALWLVSLHQLRLLRRDTASRALWFGLLGMAAFQTLAVLPLYRAVERQFQAPGATTVLQHLCILMTATAFIIMVDHLREDPESVSPQTYSLSRRAVVIVIPVALLTSVPFIFPDPRPASAALTKYAVWYGDSWVSLVHWLAYCGYVAWALGLGIQLLAHNHRHAAAGLFRTGIRVNFAGLVLSLGYLFVQASMALAWVAGLGPGLVRTEQVGEAVLRSVSLLAFCAGQTLVTLAPNLASLESAYRTSKALWHLYPLWRVLQEASPRIVLSQEHRVHRFNIARPAHLAGLLVDRVIEIRDGLLEMRTYAGPETHRQALIAARSAGIPDESAQAMAEAVTLEVGRRAKAQGGRPHADHSAIVGGTALPLDGAWLVQVARAHASFPVIPRLAELMVSSRRPVDAR